ncbi:REP-associated tyrosine transposase [Sulfurospirillum sp. 1307]
MPRKQRINEIGFYHIINRGVERRTIFIDKEDYEKFLEIVDESSETYSFKVCSFCLMDNHYHLLLQIQEENLSLIMRQINSRYSIYFNKKYKRVGPLWQGRFRSFYIYDENYLSSVIKYIEYNPIKAKITQNIGQYQWSMSSKKIAYDCFDFSLMDNIDLKSKPNEDDLKKIDELFSAKLKIKDKKVLKQSKKELHSYFEEYDREFAIANAIKDGYLQTQIANYLQLSVVSISKIYKRYNEKSKLFEKLKKKGIFWSYSKDIIYDKSSESLFVEYLLKYGDFYDIVLAFKLFGKRIMRKIWEEKVMSDQRFIKTNLMIARIFFDMDVESDYFKGLKNARFEKLRFLAS